MYLTLIYPQIPVKPLTEVYCFIDDMIKKCGKKFRKRGPEPKLSDSEVITMEIVGESLGMDCDKTIHRYFRDHWRHLFPNLGDRTAFLRQSAKLWKVKQKIRDTLLTHLLPNEVKSVLWMDFR